MRILRAYGIVGFADKTGKGAFGWLQKAVVFF